MSAVVLRPSSTRGYFDHGWLKTYHTFSFGDYFDRNHMAFRSLRVINDDVVAAGQGFGMHPHRDMEIITYILDGQLEHKDSMGTGSIIRPGDVQRMSAGTGVFHSEFNPSKTHPVRLLQIWIMPERKGLTPEYEQKSFPVSGTGVTLLVSPSGDSGSVRVHQDVSLYRAVVSRGERATVKLARPYGYVQVTAGELKIGDKTLTDGDGAEITGVSELTLEGVTDAQALIFDLA